MELEAVRDEKSSDCWRYPESARERSNFRNRVSRSTFDVSGGRGRFPSRFPLRISFLRWAGKESKDLMADSPSS